MIQIQKIKVLVQSNYYDEEWKKVVEELERADAHPYGSRPFKRENYINKFLILTKDKLSKETSRFLKVVQNLKN